MIPKRISPPVERAAPALVRRQGDDDDDQDPFESFLSDIFGPDPTTTSSSSTRINTRTSSSTSTRPTSTSSSTREDDDDDDEETTSRSRSRTSSTTSATPTIESPTRPPPTQDVPTLTVTETSSSAVNTGESNASNGSEDTAPKSGLPPVAVGVIVAASVIFGLIFLALIARKFFQSRRRAKRGTWGAGTIAPFDPPTTTVQKDTAPVSTGLGLSPGYAAPSTLVGAGAYNRSAQPGRPNSYGSYASGPQYPAFPPPASGYTPANQFSPAAASSAGYNAPYPYNAAAAATTRGAGQPNANALFNQASYAPADLSGPVPITRTPSPPAQISVVRRTFIPSLPDELSIANGESVKVIASYDDGWAMCEKLGSGEKGVVPLECLDTAAQSGGGLEAPSVNVRRASSLNGHSSEGRY